MKKLIKSANTFLQTPLAKNFAVLTGDRLVQLLSQLFNIFILANFLGPAHFGILLYAISIYGFLLSISNVGLDRVLVIKLSEPGNDTAVAGLITSGLIIKMVSSTLVFVLLYFGENLILRTMSAEVYSVLLVLAINLFCSTWVIIDAFNQSRQQFKITAGARMSAAILAIVIRVILVFSGASFTWIVWSFIAEQLMCLVLALVLSKDFFRSLIPVPAQQLWSTIVHALQSGAIVMCSTACIVIYFRTSQGIIEQKFNAIFLGVYSLVIYIIEVPVSLSSIMATLFTPKLTNILSAGKKEALQFASGVMKLFLVAGIFSSVAVMVAGLIISLVLGPVYAGFLSMLLKAVIALPIIFAAYFLNIYMLCNKTYRRYLLITFAGAAVTLLFLFVAADYVTQQTAIYLYVMSQLLASFIIPLVLHKPLRQVVYHTLRSFTNMGEGIRDMRMLFQTK